MTTSSADQRCLPVRQASFNDHKPWRGIATRTDKLAAVYRGGVPLRAIIIWLTT